jgi:pimeloyl-ACP methyl ester carboxylesterase
MHGTPGSRIGPLPRTIVLHALGVRLITFDRPGYGESDRQEFRRVVDVVPDVEAIADALGVEQFAVIGRSGGGPHALACAAKIPDRVTRAGVLVSLAPWTAQGLDWFDGMSDSNIDEFTRASTAPEALTAALVRIAAETKLNPASHVATLSPELPESDQRLMADVELRRLLTRNFAEALSVSADGWIDDSLAFCSEWGFEPADVKVPVLVWHGQDDVFSPVAHSRWLANQIPNASILIQPRAAHFSAFEALPDVLSWVIRPTD